SIDPPPVAAEGSFATNLGFDLTLPENSTVQFFGGGRIAAITVPLTLDETIAFFQGAMEANGYTLASTVNTSATELVHTYQKDAKIVVATIFTTGSGGTSINLGGG